MRCQCTTSRLYGAQAVREADAAVDHATKATKAKERAQRECNARVQDLIGDLNRLQQSQRELEFSSCLP